MPESLAFAITAIAVCISQDRHGEEIALLANIFTQLGDTLATISAAKIKIEVQGK
jgi:hypothetical protein